MINSNIIAWASVIIAACALIATFWQARLAHQHNRLSVRPLLVWHIARRNGSFGSGVCFSVKNLGLGPAIIRERYFTKDKVLFTQPEIKIDEVQTFVEHIFGRKINYQLKAFGLPGKDAAIASQDEVVIADIEFPGMPPDQLRTAMELAKGAEFHIKYESIYKEKFSLDVI